MAFSTFRGLEASSANSGPPPIVYHSLYPEVSAIPGTLGSNEDSYPTESLILPSSSTYFFTAYRQASTSSNYACMMHNPGAGYVTTGTPSILDSGTSLGGSLTMAAGSVSATGYLVATAITTTGSFNTINVSYMTSSGGTITQVASTTYFTGLIGSCAACVLDTTNSLILGDLSGSAQHISLIDSTATTQYATTTTAYSSSSQHVLLGFSTTLGAYVFTNSGGTTLYCAGIDVVSASSLTPHSAVSVTSCAAIYFNAIVLTSTTFLVIYNKSTTQYGLRIVTVGASGSVSAGTEYTYTTGNSATSQIFGSAMLSATTGILNVNIQSQAGGYNQVGVPFSITAGVIAFGSTQYPLSTNSSSSIAKSQLATLSTTQAIYTYDQSVSGIPSPFASTNIGYAGLIDYNNTNPTWGGTFAGNNALSGNFATGNIPYVTAVSYLGSNRALVAYTNAGTGNSGGWNSYQLDTNGSNIIESTTGATASLLVNQYYIIGSCRIYNDTSSNTRCLGYYYDGSGNVQFGVIYVATSGATTINTLNSGFTGTNTAANRPNMLAVNLAPDTTLYIQGNSSTALQASIITTSGATVSSIGSITTVANSTSLVVYPKFAKALSATQAVVVYMSDISAGAHAAAYVGIIDITTGTPVLTTSAALTPSGGFSPQSYCDGGFNVGANTGVLLYGDSSNAHTIGIGFSYTTSTVTVSGSTTTLSTDLPNVFSNGCCGVSATELIAQLDVNYRLITLSGINTISIGSSFASGLFSNHLSLSPTDNQNALVVADVNAGGSNSKIGYLYRG